VFLESRGIGHKLRTFEGMMHSKEGPMARERTRKVVLGLGISLDGYIARLDGSVDFLFMPKDYSMAPFFKTIDTAILGRKTYDVAKAMGGGGFGGKMRFYVMSRTLPPGEREGLIFTLESPATLVAHLRKNQGKDIWMMGGGELARDFLRADLIDELHLGVVPVLLGEGIPLFPSGFPQRDFALVENKTYSQGLIALKYERVRAKPKSKKKR
jgi:dihydrofolate reductase